MNAGSTGRSLLLLASLLAPRLAKSQPQTEVLELGGDPANRVDLAILGDGYTSLEQDRLRSDARLLLDAFFSHSPYRQYRSFFNVTLVFVVSSESGADHPSLGIFRDTALDASYECAGIQRFVCVNQADTITVASQAVPDHDNILVLVNDSTFGGATGLVSVLPIHASASDTFVHEYAHLFANLADEYDTPNPSITPCDPVVDCYAANATLRTDRTDIKWNIWIDPATPVPTPESAGFDAVIGLFEGARYQPVGVYRPADRACRMHFLDQPFCSVCAESLIRDGVYRWVDPIDGVLPSSTVSLPLADTATLTVLHLQTDPATLTVSWWIDGVLTASNAADSIRLDPLRLGSGPHEVLVRVEDQTSGVRRDPIRVLSSTRTFQIEVGPDVCGDRLITGQELCDDGTNEGAYPLGCLAGCSARAGYCGDGQTDGPETCDDTFNDGRYGGCAAGCLADGPGCGDGQINGPEICDDATNDGRYTGCASDCAALGPHCGDRIVNGPETCDDGQNDSRYGGCGAGCLLAPFCGDGIQNGAERCDQGPGRGNCETSCDEARDAGSAGPGAVEPLLDPEPKNMNSDRGCNCRVSSEEAGSFWPWAALFLALLGLIRPWRRG